MPDPDEYLIPRDLSSVNRVFNPFFIHLIYPQWIGGILGPYVHGLIRKNPSKTMQKTSFSAAFPNLPGAGRLASPRFSCICTLIAAQ